MGRKNGQQKQMILSSRFLKLAKQSMTTNAGTFLLGLLIKMGKKLKLMTIGCVPELPRESPSRTGSNLRQSAEVQAPPLPPRYIEKDPTLNRSHGFRHIIINDLGYPPQFKEEMCSLLMDSNTKICNYAIQFSFMQQLFCLVKEEPCEPYIYYQVPLRRGHNHPHHGQTIPRRNHDPCDDWPCSEIEIQMKLRRKCLS